MLSGKLWYGRTDGNLYYRTYNGTTFGPETLVDPYNDPAWSSVQTGSGQTYRGTKPGFYSEIPNVTGMFYADGYLYYSLYQDPKLYRRAFSPDPAASSVPNQATGGVVSALRETVTTAGVDWSNIAGMFLANGNLYFATRPDGALHRVPFSGGGTTGPPAGHRHRWDGVGGTGAVPVRPLMRVGDDAGGVEVVARAALALPTPG